MTNNLLIPPRDPNAVIGSQFIQNNMNLKGDKREDNILKEFKNGNIPDFLRKFKSMNLTNGTNILSILVMVDYLSIGSNEDYVRMPMNPFTAQKIADQYDCSLPTKFLVKEIWKQSVNKIPPKPWGPPYDNSMEDTYRFGVHNTTINNQIVNMDKFALTSSSKKDIVLTNKLYPNNPNKKIAIFGWIYPSGQIIQDLNYYSHHDKYSDYAQGVRLIANDIMIDGIPKRLQDIFSDPKLCSLVSDEGPLLFQRY